MPWPARKKINEGGGKGKGKGKGKGFFLKAGTCDHETFRDTFGRVQRNQIAVGVS